jgi:ubiquinone/menaquinone biosynthesis C-methylase UbiE
MPGFTQTSVYPKLWEASGLAFPELCGRLLEIACGTGRLTRHLAASIPDGATIDATDLNEAMTTIAAALVDSPNIRWRTADVAALPFDDRGFDEAFCQLGAMFFPDKIAAAREKYGVR